MRLGLGLGLRLGLGLELGLGLGLGLGSVQHPAVVEDGHLSGLQPVLHPRGGGGLDAAVEVAVSLIVLRHVGSGREQRALEGR